MRNKLSYNASAKLRVGSNCSRVSERFFREGASVGAGSRRSEQIVLAQTAHFRMAFNVIEQQIIRFIFEKKGQSSFSVVNFCWCKYIIAPLTSRCCFCYHTWITKHNWLGLFHLGMFAYLELHIHIHYIVYTCIGPAVRGNTQKSAKL